MVQRSSPRVQSLARTVLSVFTRRQTYLNIAYLLIAFPLGLLYFVFLVVGLMIGFALLLTLVGIPVLLLVHLVAWVFLHLERRIAVRLLNVQIPPIGPAESSGSLWRRLIATAADPTTWTGMFFLLVKFPVGTASFALAVGLLAATLAFVAAPVAYRFGTIPVGPWGVDSFGESVLLVPLGLAMALVSMHVLNLAAFASGRFAYLMLGARWWETNPKED